MQIPCLVGTYIYIYINIPRHVQGRVAEGRRRREAQADLALQRQLGLDWHDQDEGQVGHEVGEYADQRGQVGLGEEGAHEVAEHDGGEGERAQWEEDEAEVGEREEAAVLEDAADEQGDEEHVEVGAQEPGEPVDAGPQAHRLHRLLDELLLLFDQVSYGQADVATPH